MTVEVIGIDHVFVAVSDLRRSEGFYDRVMPVLAFRKGEGTIGGDPHLFYYNCQFVYSLRPAREGAPEHDPHAPGLHHLCFRVVDEAAVGRAATELREAEVEVTELRYYPEYAADYYATFFEDPDRIRLKVMNFWEIRRKVMYDWEARADL
jgi:catechol 2,3-dioxygenase-like lactoylglutathione lyase family enzyme